MSVQIRTKKITKESLPIVIIYRANMIGLCVGETKESLALPDCFEVINIYFKLDVTVHFSPNSTFYCQTSVC